MPSPGRGESPREATTLVPTERMVERRRAVKDAVEIDTLREAARRLSQVARQAPSIRPRGAHRARDRGGHRRGNPGCRVRAAGLRDHRGVRPEQRPASRASGTTRSFAGGDGVVLDFGGVYDGYCVDLTRTLPVGAAGAGAVADCEPPSGRRTTRRSRRSGRARGRARLTRAAREVLARHGLGEAFGHGTGHGLGLEVHEDPRISKLPGRLAGRPGRAGHGVHHRARRLRSPGLAGSGSKTTCWSWRMAATC